MPFAGYKDFADCVAKNQDKDDPKGYCAEVMIRTGEMKTSRKDRNVAVGDQKKKKR